MMEHLNMQSMDKVGANVVKIRELFPNFVTERINNEGQLEHAIDFDMLKQELSDHVVDGFVVQAAPAHIAPGAVEFRQVHGRGQLGDAEIDVKVARGHHGFIGGRFPFHGFADQAQLRQGGGNVPGAAQAGGIVAVHQQLQGFQTEVVIHIAAVDGDLAGAIVDANTGNGMLTTTGAVEIRFGFVHLLLPPY